MALVSWIHLDRLKELDAETAAIFARFSGRLRGHPTLPDGADNSNWYS